MAPAKIASRCWLKSAWTYLIVRYNHRMPRRGSTQPPKSEAHAELGRALRALRQSHGARLSDLRNPQRARRGKSEGLLSRIENGLDIPSWDVLNLYATEFGGDLAELQRLLRRAQLAEAAAQKTAPIEAVNLTAHPLTVAIALVLRGREVLLVKRARPEGELDWQFPTGVVKPIDSANEIAIREVIGETGVVAKIVNYLGERIHPVTSARCLYFQCEYLSGESANLDTNENAMVCWVPADRVPDYIPVKNIFQAIVSVLKNVAEGESRFD